MHLGNWMEGTRLDVHYQPTSEIVLDHHREYSVFFSCWSRQESAGHFPLQHHSGRVQELGLSSQPLESRRRNVVWQIAHHFEPCCAESKPFLQFTQIHIKNVLVEEVHGSAREFLI